MSGARAMPAETIHGLPHSISGVVVSGDRRGRTLGFPTANIDIGETGHTLRQGVYAVWVTIDGAELRGVAAYGKPMFDNHRPPLETHIFDFSADIYGRRITVQLVSYIREPRVFADLDGLIVAMNDDACRARDILSASTRTPARAECDFEKEACPCL